MIEVKLMEGHKSSGEWILVPISNLTTPKDGRICYCNHWWRVTEDNDVLFYRRYTSPQCNSNKAVMERVGKAFDAPITTLQYIEVAFLPHNCSDYC